MVQSVELLLDERLDRFVRGARLTRDLGGTS